MFLLLFLLILVVQWLDEL